ncbi:ABC transporter permease [Phytohabitans kaempferiae]|uniref:ABC transporter permease n=1 Tax=Phytohabitans kaempferiae TaxID=1620943 RepID=A0ABV6M399_9ACTN
MSAISATTAPVGGARSAWRKLIGYRPALIGLIVIGFFVLLALLAPVLAPYDPQRTTADTLQPPSAAHWFGTDALGRDVFSGVLHGARISLLVGAMTGIAVFAVGIVVGALAGYYGGKVDAVLMRITEVFQVLPSLVLALVTVAVLGRGVYYIAGAIALAIWPQVARIVRAQFLSLRETDMTLAARTVGYRDWRIIVGELLPNAMPPVIVQVTVDVGAAILLEAGLSFLGLGDPDRTSWGQMLQTAQSHLEAWWISVPAGAAILLVVLSINFVGDGLNHAFRPAAQENL